DLRPNNAPQSQAAPAPIPDAAPQAAPAQSRSGWSVQIASLSNPESAQALRDQLISKGFDAYVRVSRGLNRVFVGPVAERQEANRLRDRLSQQQRLDGFVVQYQPANGG
ncbi:MAG TPA: SPOR domain-containing protein, partial [Pseudomonas nitrititolerans]|nr:SPOR domain-containing protein [Stutzerimonas nitrititolerans]